MTIIHIDCFLK